MYYRLHYIRPSSNADFSTVEFSYTPEFKYEKLFTEGGAFYYTVSAKYAVIACKNYRDCLKSWWQRDMVESDASLGYNILCDIWLSVDILC